MANQTHNLRNRKLKMVPHVNESMSAEKGETLSTVTRHVDYPIPKNKHKNKNSVIDLSESDVTVNGETVNNKKKVKKRTENWYEDEETSLSLPLLKEDHNASSSSDDEKSSVEEVHDKLVANHTSFNEKNEKDEGAVQGEGTVSIALQVFIPYIIAGFGTVGAGMVLDVVQHWKVFKEVSEVFILVPSLLGLKGNLEMTLASRLSTQANLGNMNTRKEQWKMVTGNMALVQAQAIVVGFLASNVAMVMGWIPEGKFDLHHGLLLCASSIFTASMASLALGLVMVAVVLLSKKCNINPDNVATPIAASLGDLITLSLLAWVSNLLYNALGKQVWIAPTIIGVFALLIPLWIHLCLKNEYVKDVIYSGWTPVLSAMVISSFGGLILDFTVSNFHGIAVFQPVINGVGGNLVAVQASRISTYLHQSSTPGKLPGSNRACTNPFKVFCSKDSNARAARALLFLVIPGQILFIYAISYMKAGHTSVTLIFNVTYLSAAMLQVVILLFIADWMVHFIWLKGEDPDNIAIPYLTAIGDLLGTAFLAIAFSFLYYVGDRDADVGE